MSRIIRDVGEELDTRIGSSILKCCKTKDSESFTVRQVWGKNFDNPFLYAFEFLTKVCWERMVVK